MRRRLGQHFLVNRAALKRIAAALDVKSGETIVEIGAGRGELTKGLRGKKQGVRVIAIEKDRNLVTVLRKKFAEGEDVEIVEGDALKLLPDMCSKFHASSFKIAGNIPYYITGRLLRTIGELEPKPERCVFTLQKEVAERLAAKLPRMNPPHTRMWGMNRLAAAVQFWAEPKILSALPKTDFRPPPEVNSAVVLLQTKKPPPGIKPKDYYETVKILFRQPRKTVRNNLAAPKIWRGEEISRALQKSGVSAGARPQDLGVPDLIALTRELRSKHGDDFPFRKVL